MKDAACRDKAPNKREDPDAPDPWFPEKGESHNPGKIVCILCPVREQCDDYRIKTDSRYGIWAAKSYKFDGTPDRRREKEEESGDGRIEGEGA